MTFFTNRIAVAVLFLLQFMIVSATAQINWPSGQLLPSFPAPAQNQDLIILNGSTVSGNRTWRWEAEGGSIAHKTGRLETDGWLCQTGIDAANDHMVYGPYDNTVPAGPSVAEFRMKVDNNTANDDAIVDIDVRNATSGAILASRTVTRRQFPVAGDYTTISLPFTMPADNQVLELRIYWRGASYTKVDWVGVTQSNGAAEMYLFASLKGVVNRTQPRIFSYEGDAFAEGPYTWLQSLGLNWTEHADRWSLISKYRSEISGLIVYDPVQIHTVNLATILAKDRKALIVSPSLLSKLTAAPYNFPVLLDLRGQYTSKLQVYQTIYNTYWPTLDKRLLIGLNPDIHQAALREYACAVGAAVIWLDPKVAGESELLNSFLSSMPLGANYMGWWPEEGPGVERASQYGISTIASDWATNLTVHSGMPRTVNVKPIPTKPALQNKIYVAFILSDGDNLQYVEHLMRKLWNNPDRGSVPIGWTVSPAMLDAMPGALNYYHQSSTNNDNLISGPSGYGYAYPNYMGDANELNQFVAKTEDYNRRAGLRVITIWNTITGGINQNVGESFATYAPSTLGLTGQNTGGPLSIYKGTMPGMPLSCNYCTNEQAMKDHINSASAGWNGASPRFVIIQAQPWTDVKPTNFKNVMNSLNSNYIVVRPDHLFMLMREANGLVIDPNPAVNGNGDGLTASYYNGMNFETPVLSRKDANLNMNWGTGSPGTGVNADQFTVRWSGQIQPRYSGAYTFYITSDNGRRVWVNNQLIIDKWVDDWDIPYSGSITLTAGQKYDIKVEMFENNGGSNVKLEWSSASQIREIIPTSQLYSNPVPSVSITSPANNASFNAPATIAINANASDNASVAKVDFYNGNTFLGSDNTSPFSYSWTNVAAGTYTIKAVATDNSGAFTISNNVNVTVNNTGVTLTAPSNLTAKTFSSSQINLKWNDNSNNETGFVIQMKKGISGTYSDINVGANVTSYNVTGLTALSTYFFRVKAVSGTSGSVYSNEAIAATTVASWTKAANPIWTTWGQAINDPTNVLQEYPRPQMVKDTWQNLNGVWDVWEGTDINFTGSKKGILVPFPIQSALSGVKQNWHNFTYEKYIGIPQEWNGKRVILHFGAVDFQAEIFINGQSVLLHKGGYDPFSIDITDRVAAGNSYRLNVRVWDPHNTEGFPGPQGKQRDDRFGVNPFGIDYTPTGGIWQTVWMEAVPTAYISDIKMVPNIDNGTLQLTVTTSGSTSGITFEATAKDGAAVVNTISGGANATVTLSIPNQKLWSPDSPFLYDLSITLKNGTTVIETVQSYFGMRKISLGKVNGITRMLLNNQFVFQMGPLDQGFWPDGIYTPPAEAGIVFDLQGMKNLGYNMVRKHIKVEPARWYYNADKLGLLVWQDVVNGANETTAQRDQYKLEMERMIRTHWNHPSIIMWVPFNEQWGMFDSAPIATFVMNLDPSRLVNENSGCCGAPYSTVGHVKDYHYYSAPSCPHPDDNRAVANGEFAGVVLRKPGNMWNDNAWSDWARVVGSDNEFTSVVTDYCNILKDLRDYRGMSAAVFTQWTDVEAEINGNYTYDRKILKGDAAQVKNAFQSTTNLNSKYVNPPTGFSVIESYNMPAHFVRHQNSRGRMNNIIAPLADSYWKLVPGLAGAGISFQSQAFPDQYLRHFNGELVLAVNDGSQGYKEDATFYMRPGLANSSLVSFESYNFAGRYIRHRDFLLYSEAVTDDLGRNDATFFVYGTSAGNGNGDGLSANYFNGTNFETPALSRKDAVLNMDWGGNSPGAGVNADLFSVRWTGQVQPRYSGTYTFYINSDNGRRVWVNNQLIIDKWVDDWGIDYSGTITLTAGQKYDIKVELFENVGGANVKLEWSSAQQSREVIPTSQLYSNPLPTVSVSSNITSANAPANFALSANASDADGIAKVDFYNGTTLIGSDNTSPYTFAWNGVAAGSYMVTALATDTKGGVTLSSSILLKSNGTTNNAPTIGITAPANNAAYTAPASITINANASDSDGTISNVQFYNGTTLLNTDNTSPYSFTWNNVSAGTYTITARATDNAGAVTTSAAITVVVNNVTNPCSGIPQYTENGGYVAGSIVQNAGSRYQCKPYPYTGWCNGAAWAYAPGTGAYWGDAWTLVGPCTARIGEEVTANNALIVPNPTSGAITIQLNTASRVSVYNSLGTEMISSLEVNANGEIDLSHLSAGLYLLKIDTGSEVITQTVLKK